MELQPMRCQCKMIPVMITHLFSNTRFCGSIVQHVRRQTDQHADLTGAVQLRTCFIVDAVAFDASSLDLVDMARTGNRCAGADRGMRSFLSDRGSERSRPGESLALKLLGCTMGHAVK